MPSTLHPTGPADYLSLAEQHQHNQSDSGSLHRSHGYLFTGLVLLLPTVRSHVRDKYHGSDRPEDGLVIGTRKKKDIKGKGKMNHDQASRSDLIKGEDMIVLFRLLCLLASEYRHRNLSPTSEILYDLNLSTLADTNTPSLPGLNHIPIRLSPQTDETTPDQGVTGSIAGAEIVKQFKPALERLMDGETVFVCREDIDGELELIDEKFELERGRGELIRACLALCLYVLCKTQPSNNISFYSLQLQELYPVYLKRADTILETLFSESPMACDSGPSTPVSPTSTTGQSPHNRSRPRFGVSPNQSPRAHRSALPKRAGVHDTNSVNGRTSFVSTASTRRPIFLPSRPSMISMFSTESNGTTTGRSFISYTSTFSALDNVRAKSTASLPQLSEQVQDSARGHLEALPKAERRGSRLKGFGMSMIDIPSRSSGLSIAEERLKRYQRNAAITAQHGQAPGFLHSRARTSTGIETGSRERSEEKGWFSTFNFGTKRFTSRTALERKVDKDGSALITTVAEAEETSPLVDKSDRAGKPVVNEHTGYMDCVYENGHKQPLPHTPAATPAPSRQLPLIVSFLDQEDAALAKPINQNPAPPKRALRAFEDESDPPLAPMDPKLLAAEMSSAMTQKVVCSVCDLKGVNFPSCRKCGDTFCSRECRVGLGAGGDGKKHVCGLFETRLLTRAAKSPNGQLLPSPPTVKPVKRLITT